MRKQSIWEPVPSTREIWFAHIGAVALNVYRYAETSWAWEVEALYGGYETRKECRRSRHVEGVAPTKEAAMLAAEHIGRRVARTWKWTQ